MTEQGKQSEGLERQQEQQREVARIVSEKRSLYARTPWFPIFWVWVVIVGALFFWFAAWGWGSYGGWWYGHANAAAPIVGSNINVLLVKDKTAAVGQAFNFQNVPVQKRVNDQAFWIGPNGRDLTLLVVPGNAYSAGNRKISKGDRISANGVVEKAPPAQTAQQNWNLNSEGAQRLQQEQGYLQAKSVDFAPVQPNPGP